jgi:hypothetical protein
MTTPTEAAAPAVVARGDDLLRRAALFVLASATLGLLARLLVWRPLTVPARMPNVFYYLYVRNEEPFLWLLAAFALVAWWLAVRDARWIARLGPTLARMERALASLPAWSVALAVLVMTAAGTVLVIHGVGVSMDEHAITFQARLLLAGKLTAPIPSTWQPLAPWLTPIFVNHLPVEHRWVAAYFPGYAAIRALFTLLGAPLLTNPMLAAASVLLLSACATRLWPARPRRALLAVVLLATSSQFLIMSMTGYSMPAYLALDLLWLYLYLRADAPSWGVLPWVGVAALGLHNPFPHALFVVPFLLRALRERRWRWLSYWGVIYVAGSALWLGWLRLSAGTPVAGQPPGPGLLANFALPNRIGLLTQSMNLGILFTWQTPAAVLLLVAALFAWRKLERTERDLAAGLLLTFGFYFLYPSNQGHGWGYRYVYGALGNLALLGAVGGSLLIHRWPEQRRRTVSALLAASLAATLLFQWPLRVRQVERFVAPYARALDFIEHAPAPLVAVDVKSGWYAQDLVRNDPLFEHRPLVFVWVPGYGPDPSLLPAALRDSVYVISRREMAGFGMAVFPPAGAPQR